MLVKEKNGWDEANDDDCNAGNVHDGNNSNDSSFIIFSLPLLF